MLKTSHFQISVPHASDSIFSMRQTRHIPLERAGFQIKTPFSTAQFPAIEPFDISPDRPLNTKSLLFLIKQCLSWSPSIIEHQARKDNNFTTSATDS